MPFAVTIHEKGGQPRRQEFDKTEVTIGRVQGNDIILPKQNVSKRHSRIVVKDGKFIIVDLKSTNGTYVNGRKIASPMVIKETDKIYIGDFILSAEPMSEGADAGASSAAPPKVPPPPPRRSPAPAQRPAAPAPAPAPASPRPRAPRPTGSPERPKPEAMAAAPSPAIEKRASYGSGTPEAAKPSAPAALAPAAPAKIQATADQAPGELYRWLLSYTAQQGITLPQSFDLEAGVNGTIANPLTTAATAAVEGISGIDAQALGERAVAEVLGAGALTELLGDSSIERIFFNAPDSAWISRGGETTRSSGFFSCVDAMEAGARRLLSGSVQNGIGSGYLADGTRIHFVSSTHGGPYITVDRPDRSGASLEDMIAQEVLSNEMASYLTTAVELGRVIVVSSNDLDVRFDFISALLKALNSDQRAILIESGGRLAKPNAQSIQLNGRGIDLVAEALLMRPDYLVAGDSTGLKSERVLGALRGSVNGGILGVNAESPDDALVRLIRQSTITPPGGQEAVKALLKDKIDIMVQVLAFADGSYRVTQIMDVDGEIQETFAGFDGFSGAGHVPRWYENAVSLGHNLESNIFG